MTLASLIERVEKAGAGSRELDADIHPALGLLGEVQWVQANYTMDNHPYVLKPCKNNLRGFSKEPLPRWTTSLDAALALAGRVLPGGLSSWEVSAYKASKTDDWFVGLRPYEKGGFGADAPTPALALVLAVLRAKESERIA